jgi:hypothetical protein
MDWAKAKVIQSVLEWGSEKAKALDWYWGREMGGE